MFHILKQSGRLIHFFNFLLLKNQRHANLIRPYSYFVNYYSQIALNSSGQNKGFLVSYDQSRLIVSRDKHGGRKKKQGKPRDEESSDEDTDEEEVEEEDDDDEGDQNTEKGALIRTYSMKSLRVDSILKAMLRSSRKTIEKNFYENRIRVNGEKIQKKSQHVNVKDVIDVIKGPGNNLNTIIVGQVKIHKIHRDVDADMFHIKASACRSLEIENYKGANAWRQPEEDGDSF